MAYRTNREHLITSRNIIISSKFSPCYATACEAAWCYGIYVIKWMFSDMCNAIDDKIHAI